MAGRRPERLAPSAPTEIERPLSTRTGPVVRDDGAAGPISTTKVLDTHHTIRIKVDVGSGFAHLEPEGGAPTHPAPGHLYHYLVQGLASVAQFRWVDEVTSDDYAVLTITVERVTVTDVETSPAAHNRMLLPNIPDPFNPTTAIRYALATADVIRLDIYDVHGRLVRHPFAGSQAPGSHVVRWDGVLDRGVRAPAESTTCTRRLDRPAKPRSSFS